MFNALNDNRNYQSDHAICGVCQGLMERIVILGGYRALKCTKCGRIPGHTVKHERSKNSTT